MKCLEKVSFHLYALMFLLMLEKPIQVYIFVYVDGQSESNRMQLCVYSEDRETDSSP